MGGQSFLGVNTLKSRAAPGLLGTRSTKLTLLECDIRLARGWQLELECHCAALAARPQVAADTVLWQTAIAIGSHGRYGAAAGSPLRLARVH